MTTHWHNNTRHLNVISQLCPSKPYEITNPDLIMSLGTKPGGHFNIKMLFNLMGFPYKDKTVLSLQWESNHIHTRNTPTKTISLLKIRAFNPTCTCTLHLNIYSTGKSHTILVTRYTRILLSQLIVALSHCYSLPVAKHVGGSRPSLQVALINKPTSRYFQSSTSLW